MQSAASILPPAGSTQALPGSPSENTGRSSWVQPPLPSQDPFSSQFSNYWSEASTAQGQLSPQRRDSLGPLTSSSSLPYWSTLLSSGGMGVPPSPVASAGWGRRNSGISPKFDGRDRLSLGDGWFLIRGENGFFLELAGDGLDVPTQMISTRLAVN